MIFLVISGALVAPYIKKQFFSLLNVTFSDLVNRSNSFALQIKHFPTIYNRIERIADSDKKIMCEIERQARDVRPIAAYAVKQLITDFLRYKNKYGSLVERSLYAHTGPGTFVDRLLVYRPLMFVNSSDDYLIRGRDGKIRRGGFEFIGTPRERYPLVLKDYLSYDEMAIAALLGVSVPTYFINNGSRTNRGVPALAGTFEESGIYVGLVGARFEKPGYMEWAHIMVTSEQNTAANGYGDVPVKGRRAELLALWARFYQIPYFYTYEQAAADRTGRFLRLLNGFFDTVVYKERLKKVLVPFLVDANERGAAAHQKVYCHVVGLGTGVWAVTQRQEEYMFEVYVDILKEYTFTHIADIDFSWFGLQGMNGLMDNTIVTTAGNNITIHFSKRNPADKLLDANEGKLLVAMYAWDGNAYPGNEYWAGNLAASGDPAAACCSTIAELQNPFINPNVSKFRIKYYK